MFYVNNLKGIYLSKYISTTNHEVSKLILDGNDIDKKSFLEDGRIINWDLKGNVFYLKDNKLYVYDNLKGNSIEVKRNKEFDNFINGDYTNLVNYVRYFSNIIYWSVYRDGQVQSLYLYNLLENQVESIDCKASGIIMEGFLPMSEDKFIYTASDSKGQQFQNNVGIIDLKTKKIGKPINVGPFFDINVFDKDKVIVGSILARENQLNLFDFNLETTKPLLKVLYYKWVQLSPDNKTIAYAIQKEDSKDKEIYVARIKDDTLYEKTLVTTLDKDFSLFWSEDSKNLVVEIIKTEENAVGENDSKFDLSIFSIGD